LAPRDVGPASERAVPLAANGLEELGVGGLDRDVDGSGAQIARTHRVPAEHLGLAHRDIVLEVRLTPLDLLEGAEPVPLDEDPGLLEVTRLVQGSPQLRERNLDLGVAADPLAPVRTELRAHVVGRAHGHLDELVAHARTRPAAPRPVGMPHAVQPVAPLWVGVPGRLTLVAKGRRHVAVRVLRLDDARRHLADASVDRLVTRAGVLPRERLEVLVDLRVGKLPTLPPLDRAPGRDEVEVAEPPGLLEPVPDVSEGRRTVELLAAGPGPAGDGDLVEPERDEG